MRRSRALLQVFLACSISSLFASPSRAAELTWDAPAGCPDRDAVRWRVEDALGLPLEKAAGPRFSAKVEQKPNKRWSVVLEVSSESYPQRRELEGSSCDDLVRAAAVAIALALGADAEKASDTGATAANADEQESAKPEREASVSLIRADVTPKNLKVSADTG